MSSRRINVLLNADSQEILEEDRLNGLTMTESIRRAISVYKFFLKAKKDGSKIFMQEQDGQKLITEIKFL